jgi:hypothetical protein
MGHKGASAEPAEGSAHNGIQMQQHKALLPNH